MKNMKKFIVFALTLTMIFSLNVLSVFAAPDGASLGDVPQTLVSITVDAKKDDIYDQGLVIPLERPLSDTEPVYGTKGTAWALFNNSTLYILVHVEDNDIETPDPVNQTGTPWSTESVEIFIDVGNSGDVSNVLQYRIDVTGWPCVYTQAGRADYGSEAVGDAFSYAARLGTNEYWVEFAIPVDNSTTIGNAIGFQIQINDRNTTGDGTQSHVMSPSSLGASSWTAETYDYIVVGAELVIEEEVIAEEAPTEDAAPVTSTPVATETVTAVQTSDMTIINAIFSVGAMLTSGAAILISKKKK